MRTDKYYIDDMVTFRDFGEHLENVQYVDIVCNFQKENGLGPYKVTQVTNLKVENSHSQLVEIKNHWFSGWWFNELVK